MIDKLDKWIAQQRHNKWVDNNLQCIPLPCYFDHQGIIDIPMIPDLSEQPPMPELPIFMTLWEIDRMIENAINNEREACAKLCEEPDRYSPYDPGGGFAKLIRERSDD